MKEAFTLQEKMNELKEEIEKYKTALFHLRESYNSFLQKHRELQERIEQIQGDKIVAPENISKSGRKPLEISVITRIKDLREQGYNRRQISEQLGVSYATVSKYCK